MYYYMYKLQLIHMKKTAVNITRIIQILLFINLLFHQLLSQKSKQYFQPNVLFTVFENIKTTFTSFEMVRLSAIFNTVCTFAYTTEPVPPTMVLRLTRLDRPH